MASRGSVHRIVKRGEPHDRQRDATSPRLPGTANRRGGAKPRGRNLSRIGRFGTCRWRHRLARPRKHVDGGAPDESQERRHAAAVYRRRGVPGQSGGFEEEAKARGRGDRATDRAMSLGKPSKAHRARCPRRESWMSARGNGHGGRAGKANDPLPTVSPGATRPDRVHRSGRPRCSHRGVSDGPRRSANLTEAAAFALARASAAAIHLYLEPL